MGGQSLDQDNIKNAWEGDTKSLTADQHRRRLQKLAGALQKVRRKILRINILLALIIVKLFKDPLLFVFTPRRTNIEQKRTLNKDISRESENTVILSGEG